MAYTVKRVAVLSGVSVRTLHFYDEVGLLKPAYYGTNGYRFYEEPQLLTLQQILFYRELGFGLKEIKKVLPSRNPQKVAALRSHRKILARELARLQGLTQTIDKTIDHLKGRKKMKSQQLFAGFRIAAAHDRFGEHLLLGEKGPAGEPLDCKLSGNDTGGAVSIFEFRCRSGGPRHSHTQQDEWLYILEGEYAFQVGKERFELHAGESLFIPRTIPHVWGTLGAAPGKVLNIYQPAGLMESFFRKVASYDGHPPIHEALGVEGLHRLFEEHQMDLLGPPLGWETTP
jgi:DNA-binding transcriptional MerR regulator/uncharacterized cupin superfamily protein